MYFVMQMLKKVFRVENGFGMVVTKKGLEVGTKKVCTFKVASDRSFLGIGRDMLLGLGLGWGWGFWGFRLYLLKVVSSDHYEFLHNFLISQDLSLTSSSLA